MKIERTDTWQNGRVKSATTYFDTYHDDVTGEFEIVLSGDCCIETDYYHDGGFNMWLDREQIEELYAELGTALRKPEGGGLLPCPDCGLTTPDPKAFCTTCTIIGGNNG
jgi:hypothetical protein